MEEASNQRKLPPPDEISEDKHPSIAITTVHPHAQALTSISGTWTGRTTLYDLYKLETTQEGSWALYSPPPTESSEEKWPSTTHLQQQTQTPIRTLSPWNGGSELYDSYELKSIIHELDQALYNPSSQESSAAKCLPTTPTTMLQAQTPNRRLSPWNGHSVLYDSFELKAVAQQFNHAICTAQENTSVGPTATHPQLQVLTAMLRSRTSNGHSTLYDSYELETIIRELGPALYNLPDQETSEEKHHSTTHLQLQVQTPVWRLSPSNGGSMHHDSYKLRGVVQELDQVPHHSPMQKSTGEKQLSMTPTRMHLQLNTRTPLWRLSPWNRGSTLYDSYELKAVAQQLNRAIQSTRTYPHQQRSPFYPSSQRLDRLYKENATAPKRVTCPHVSWGPIDAKTSNKSTQGIVPRLWKKLKRTFLPSKRS